MAPLHVCARDVRVRGGTAGGGADLRRRGQARATGYGGSTHTPSPSPKLRGYMPRRLHPARAAQLCDAPRVWVRVYVCVAMCGTYNWQHLRTRASRRTPYCAHVCDGVPPVCPAACRARPDWSDGVHTPRSPHPNHDQHHTPEQVHARVPVLGTGTRRPPHSRRKAPPAQREVGWAPTPTPAFIGGVTGWVWAASLL